MAGQIEEKKPASSNQTPRYLMEVRGSAGNLIASSHHSMDTLLDAFCKEVVAGYMVTVKRKPKS